MDSEGLQMLGCSADFWKMNLETKSCQRRPLYLPVPCVLYRGLRAPLSDCAAVLL